MLIFISYIFTILSGLLISNILLFNTRSRISIKLGSCYVFGVFFVYILLDKIKISSETTLVLISVIAIIYILIQLKNIKFDFLPTNSPFFILISSLIIFHVSLELFDILNRPVFPWDAWTTWLYRSKAWFYANGLSEIGDINEFWNAGKKPVYTITIPFYPDLTSVLGYWQSSLINNWNEQIIGIAWWVLQISISIAIYGVSREFCISSSKSIALSYIFIAIPIISVQVTLSGYSDLWMAGSSGLGYLLSFLGLKIRSKQYVIFGIILCIIGVFIKREGTLWLLILLTIILFNIFSWRKILGLAVFTLSVIVVTNYKDISESLMHHKQLILPLIGPFKISYFNVTDPLVKNMYFMGNWNIMWYFIVLSTLAGVLKVRDREVRLALIFIIIPFLSILGIFYFSENGRWALSYTAVNRLFIHFMPLWIVSSAILLLPKKYRESDKWYAL